MPPLYAVLLTFWYDKLVYNKTQRGGCTDNRCIGSPCEKLAGGGDLKYIIIPAYSSTTYFCFKGYTI